MKPSKQTPTLWSENLDETIAFYTYTLNFVCGGGNDEWQWAGLFNGAVEIMIPNPTNISLLTNQRSQAHFTLESMMRKRFGID